MLFRRFLAHALALPLLGAATALAAGVDLGAFADRIDPIGCARAAHEAGDLGVMSQLASDASREALLVAVRAAPYVHAPEELVVSLVELACGRDPSLAPEAALSLHAIAERLTPSELAAREVILADLAKAEERVGQGCEHAPAADVVFALEEAKLRLQALHEGSSR